MSETDAPIALLAVEDDPTDRSWLELMLKDATAAQYTLRFVGTMADALTALGSGAFNCVLLDLSLPDCDGLESVRRVLDKAPMLPIVVFTGQKDQELGLRAIEAGAQDYLVKGQASGNTILQAARWASARLAARSRLAASDVPLVDRLVEAWACVDLSLDLDMANDSFLQLLGLTEPEVLGHSVLSFVADEDRRNLLTNLQQLVGEAGVQSVVQIVGLTHRSGDTMARTLIATPTRTDGAIDGLFVIFGSPPPPPPPPTPA